MNTIDRLKLIRRQLLGTSLALCLAPIAGAQTVPPGGADDDAPPPILDPSIPYIASGLSGNDDLDLGPNDLHLTDARDTYAGTLSGEGGLHILGGNQTLTGTNTYAGGTTIGEGATVTIGHHAALGTGGLALNGGNLTVTQTMSTDRPITLGPEGASITTLDGATLHQQGDISGPGGLVKLGGGRLVVSGANTFAGGTLIEGGTVRIEHGSSLGTGEILLRGGTLETAATLITEQPLFASGLSGVNVHPNTTATLAGDLLATDNDTCFVKSGGGHLRLTGNASLAGGACVNEGSLSASGDIASTFLRVGAPATLRGTGVIHAPVSIEGQLAAGDGPGTLQIEGAVTLQTSATLGVDIDGDGIGNGAGNYSRVVVVGEGHAFVADGTLSPTLRGMGGGATNSFTPALGSTYRIVEAEGGVSGRFTAIEQPAEGLATNTRFLAFYGTNDGHAIDLRVTPASYAHLAGLSAKRNTAAAAHALDRMMAAQDSGTAPAAQTALLYTVSAADGGRIGRLVSRLSGEVHADTAAASRQAGLGMQRDVADHLATEGSAESATRGAWAQLARDGSHTRGGHQGNGFDASTGRSLIGFDLYASDRTVLGLAATHLDTRVNALGGSGRIRGNAGIAYARQALGAVVLDGMVSRGTSTWTTRRLDPLGGQQLASRSGGTHTVVSTTLRIPMHSRGGHRIEPYAGVVWQKVGRGAARERGDSAAALSVGKFSSTGARISGGVALSSRADEPLVSPTTWRLDVGVGRDGGRLLSPTMHQSLAGMRLDTAAAQVGRGFAHVQAHGTVRLAKVAYLYGRLGGEARSRGTAYSVSGAIRVAL